MVKNLFILVRFLPLWTIVFGFYITVFLFSKPDRSDIPDEIGIQRRAGTNAPIKHRSCFSKKYELLFFVKQVFRI
jgi:hypothetical protein